MLELDGRPATADEVSGLMFLNYGHFTSFEIRDRGVRGLPLHLDRLRRDCRTLFDVELPLTRVLRFTGRAAAPVPVVARVTVFNPNLQMGTPAAGTEMPSILVSTRTARPAGELPFRLKSTHYERESAGTKHVSLFGSIQQRRLAQLEGFDDALFVDTDSYISEGPTWNIGFYDGDRVVWPKADVLCGVTMRLLESTLTRSGIQSSSASMSLRDIRDMRCAFATNAAFGVRAIACVDDTELSTDNSLIRALRLAYSRLPFDPLPD